MAQPNLEVSFTKKYHREQYAAVSPKNPDITAAGKIVIITGGSKGIGYAIANAFGMAKASATILLARSQMDLHEAHTLLENSFVNTTFCYCPVDITDSKSMTSVFDSIRVKVGEPNILVLGAAYLHPLKAALDVPNEELDRSFDVNFKANVRLVRNFFDPMKQYPKTKILINVSTVAAHTWQSQMSAYGASKAALINWLEHIQFENQDRLRIHHMHPGIIRTDLLKERIFGVGGWHWENGKSSFMIIADYINS